jgi:hypothetical protein
MPLSQEDLCAIASPSANLKKVSRCRFVVCPDAGLRGATEAEAIENIKNAIREYLAVVGKLRGEEFREIDVVV